MKPLYLSGLLLILVATDLCGRAQAQRQPKVLPEEARQRLDYAIGEWDIVSRSYSAKGEIVREIKGKDTNRYVIDGRVVENTNEFPALGNVSKAWMFYNFQEEKFYLTSVDKNGALWVLSGGLDKYVLTSKPRKQPDGSELIIRFTHENIEPDSFEAQMQMSKDGGKTWRNGYRQFLRRVKPGSNKDDSQQSPRD